MTIIPLTDEELKTLGSAVQAVDDAESVALKARVEHSTVWNMLLMEHKLTIGQVRVELSDDLKYLVVYPDPQEQLSQIKARMELAAERVG